MAIDTAVALHEALAQHHLLDTAQLAQLGQWQGRFPNPRAVAKELVQRGWLTPYQINQLFQGNGRDLVLGHYVLLERLGEGGMGQVFKARQQKLGRVVALKVIRKDKLSDAEAVQRFRREIQAASQLAHPNVVAAMDADQADDAHFLVMEYVEGADLGRLVREKGPLPIAQACEYIRQAALGLEHAHEKGLVHRDVKPSNLLLTTGGKGGEGVVKLLDLGLARLVPTGLDEPSAITQMGIVVGTPDYMSPEQARNASKADIRSDLYSLGCTFYYLLTGQVPFIGDTPTEKLIKHCFEQPPPVEQWRPDCPPRVSAIVRKLMLKEPDQRYQTPAKLVVALGRPGLLTAADDKPLSRFFRKIIGPAPAVREDAPERLRKVADRRKWLRYGVIGGAALVGLVVVCAGFFLFRGSGGGPGKATTAAANRGGRLPLDTLDAKAIPADEHFPWQPKELVAVVGKHRGHIWGTLSTLAVSPNGQWIAGGTADGTLRIWEAATLRELGTFRDGVGSSLGALQFSPDGQVLAGGFNDGTVHLWEMTKPKPTARHVLRGNRLAYSIFALAFSPDARTLASGGNDGLIHLWDLTRPAAADYAVARADERAVTALAFSPDGKSIASAGRDENAIRVWDISSVKLTERFPMPLRGHQSEVSGLAFTPSGDRLLSTSQGRYLRIWDMTDGKQLQATEAGRGSNACGALSPDGRVFAYAAGANSPVHVWDVAPELRERPGNLGGSSVGTNLIALSTGGKALVTAGSHRLQVWDVSSPKGRLIVGTDDPIDVRSVALASDGRTLATGGFGGRLRLWDLGNAEPTEQSAVNAHTGMVGAVKFSTDGKLLATAGSEGIWRLWNVEAGKASDAATMPSAKMPIHGLDFSADGKTLAVGGYDRTIRLYDLAGGKPTPRGEALTTSGPGEFITGIALEPGGKAIAARFVNRTARLWDLSGPKPRPRDLRVPQGGVTALDFSPDGGLLAVGTTVGVRLWDMQPEPKDRGELSYGTPVGPVHAVAFSPDGKYLAVSYATRLVLWDVAAQKVSRDWEWPGGADDLAFGPDGRHLITANSNGTVYVLRLTVPMFR